MWRDDSEMFATMRSKLFTAVVGDVLDAGCYLHQFLPQGIQPLRDDMIVVGRALPVLEEDIVDPDLARAAARAGKPCARMLQALDDLKENEVYTCTGASLTYATWGELMSIRALRLGCAGAVLNACSRDSRGILQLNFPTFSRGRYAQDQRPRGHVVDFRAKIHIGNVEVSPGDIVFGDLDGVVIIPRSIEQDVLREALDRVSREHLLQTAFEKDGMSAVDAVAKYGVM
jgi:regulator of RNase E activity RraA